MKFRKFFSSLVVFTAALGLLGYAGYRIYGNLTDSKTREVYERQVNFVPQEVSPYQEDEGRFFYYKATGGEQYLPARFWEDRALADVGPTRVCVDGDRSNVDITDQVRYDTAAQVLILPAEFMEQLSPGEYFFHLFNDEDVECDCLHLVVLEEVTFNVPAGNAYLECALNRDLYYSKEAHNEISLYFYNIGDNPIVDVVKFFDESENGLLHPDDYVISETGNKVTISDAYLSGLPDHTKLSLGVRFSDGTILKPDYRNIWVVEDEWDGMFFTDLADYSLSSGEDFVAHYDRAASQKLHTIWFGNLSGEEVICAEPIDWWGHENVDRDNNAFIVPAEFMAQLPEGEYSLDFYYYFNYENNVYCYSKFPFRIVP